jgi:tetratricopeptide (TPR) repeat protein
MTDRVHSFLLLLSVLASALLLCRPLATARSDEPHWIRINTDHFSVVTDADEKRGREVVVRFEQMRSALGQLLARSRVNMPEPVDIIAVRSDEEYAKVAPIRQGQIIADPAFFIPGEDRVYFVLNLSRDDSWRAICADLAQMFLKYNYPPTQPWFDAGFAQYFASIQLDDKEGQIGGDPASFTELLNATAWLPIPDLFKTQQDLSTGQQSSRHTLFYAQSWIVMHYLLNQNQLPETGNYFDLVQNQQLPIDEAIQKAYGMNAAQFVQAVKSYFHSLAPPSQTQEKGKPTLANTAGNQPLAVTPAEQIGGSTVPITEAEGQALLAEMSVRLPERREQAMQQLEAITTGLKTDNVVARRGLAWAYMQKKDFPRAVEELSKGAELAPKDPWLHYYSALVRRAQAQAGGQGTEALPNMMQDLRLVLNWDPEFAEARSMLAMAQLEGGGVHGAMDTMRAAIQLSPRNQTYLLNMAQIYMAGKNWDAATALLERLEKSPDSQVAKAAREQLEGLPMLKKYGVMPQSETKPSSQQTATANSPSSSSPASIPASPSTSAKPAQAQPNTQKQNPKPDEDSIDDRPEQPPGPPQIDKRSINFLKGRLIAVDCSQAPAAFLTVSAGAKLLKLRTEDYKSLTLIGADAFSCDWKGRAVAVNYRAGGKADGDLVSLEVQ